MNLKYKLLLSFGCAILVPSVVIGGFSYYAAQAKVKQEINSTGQTSMALFNQSLTNMVMSWEADVSVLTADVNQDQYPTDTGGNTAPVDTALTNFISSHHSFLHIYVGTNQGVFIQRPYSQMPVGYNPSKRPWYQDALKHPGQTIITSPYKDASTGDMVITIAKELPNQNGVVGADVTLNELNKLVRLIHIGAQGSLGITDPTTKVIIANGDKTVPPGTVANFPFMAPMYKSQSGMLSFTLQGQTKVMEFLTNPITGWKISAVIFPQDYTEAALPILWTTLLVLIITLLAGAILTVLFVRSITKRLNRLIEGSRLVAQGDLTVQIRDSAVDELGLLAQGFDYMITSLRNVLKQTSDTAQQVAASSEQLTASAEETSQATQSIASTMEEVAAGSESQANQSEVTANSMKEMTDGVRHIAVNAQNVTTSALNSSEAAADGYESLQSVQEQILQISQSSTTLTEAVQHLGEHSARIGSIVDMITEIASQTNLLALNAAIEAARAGEHGRGFAVVAEEVRKLAEQSAQSAREIADVIHTIQSETNRTVEESTQVSKAVEDGLGKVDAARNSFAKIRSAIEEVSTQIQEVSAAVQQLSASSEEITGLVGHIAEIATSASAGTQTASAAAEEQLASMEEISASASSLSHMAEELQTLVSRFQID